MRNVDDAGVCLNTQQSTSDFHIQGILKICMQEGSDWKCNNITYYESIHEEEKDKESAHILMPSAAITAWTNRGKLQYSNQLMNSAQH